MTQTQWNGAAELAAAKKRYKALKAAGKSNYRAASAALEEVNDSYGVEGLTLTNSDSELLYANRGDTYANTVMAYVGYERVTFKLGCWGDLVELGYAK